MNRLRAIGEVSGENMHTQVTCVIRDPEPLFFLFSLYSPFPSLPFPSLPLHFPYTFSLLPSLSHLLMPFSLLPSLLSTLPNIPSVHPLMESGCWWMENRATSSQLSTTSLCTTSCVSTTPNSHWCMTPFRPISQ